MGNPLLCRLALHHAWHYENTEDGGRYRRCLKCGKYDDETGRPGAGDGFGPAM
jgi:hypothetical protein